MALLVVDMQLGFDDVNYWGPRNNLACEDNINALLKEWRSRSRPVVFVRHDSNDPASPLRPGQSGNDFKIVVTGEPDLLVAKHVNSGFHGAPDLDAWLRVNDLDGIVLAGSTTNHCCETTARVAGTWATRSTSRSTPPTPSIAPTRRLGDHRGRARARDRYEPVQRVRHHRHDQAVAGRVRRPRGGDSPATVEGTNPSC